MMKRVRVSSHEPIAVEPNWPQSWADVNIRFKVRPGRRERFVGPTLYSRPELKAWIATDRGAGDMRDIDRLVAVDARLDDEAIVVSQVPDAPGIPDVFTAADAVTRVEANRMLVVLMCELGYERCKFVWMRWPREFVIMPTPTPPAAP